MFIEIFLISELLFNVVDHVYCPIHRLCSAEETAEVLEKLGVSLAEKYDKLPCILAKDPMIRYYGITQGHPRFGYDVGILRNNLSGRDRV